MDCTLHALRLPAGRSFRRTLRLPIAEFSCRRGMIILLAGLMLGSGRPAAAQEFFRPDPKYNPGRVNGVVIAEAAIGTAVTIGLNYLWYKKFPHSKFHMFNDNNEWLSMDKMGHATTAYNIAAIQSDLLRWGGVRSGASAIAGT